MSGARILVLWQSLAYLSKHIQHFVWTRGIKNFSLCVYIILENICQKKTTCQCVPDISLISGHKPSSPTVRYSLDVSRLFCMAHNVFFLNCIQYVSLSYLLISFINLSVYGWHFLEFQPLAGMEGLFGHKSESGRRRMTDNGLNRVILLRALLVHEFYKLFKAIYINIFLSNILKCYKSTINILPQTMNTPPTENEL